MEMDFKICFVCTGNACRSPFAECVTRKLLADAGLQNIEVYSLGTVNWGKNPRDAVMKEVAAQMGYQLTGTTTPMTRERLMEADVVSVFSQYQRNAVTRELDYAHWNRIALFNRIALGQDGDVEDPSSQTTAVYQRVAQHIEHGCKRLVGEWKKQPPKSEG